MKIISRKEAIKHGLTKHFTGKPCKHGHICERYTFANQTSGACIKCHEEKNKRFKEKNPDYQKNISKKWYEKNKEYRREQEKIKYHENPEYYYKMARKRKLNDPVGYLIMIARKRAKKKGIVFNLSAKFIKTLKLPEKCPCCSKKLIVCGKDRKDSPSLDRIINSLGYIDNNVMIICHDCNWKKGDRDKLFFKFWYDTIKKTEKLFP